MNFLKIGRYYLNLDLVATAAIGQSGDPPTRTVTLLFAGLTPGLEPKLVLRGAEADRLLDYLAAVADGPLQRDPLDDEAFSLDPLADEDDEF